MTKTLPVCPVLASYAAAVWMNAHFATTERRPVRP